MYLQIVGYKKNSTISINTILFVHYYFINIIVSLRPCTITSRGWCIVIGALHVLNMMPIIYHFQQINRGSQCSTSKFKDSSKLKENINVAHQ